MTDTTMITQVARTRALCRSGAAKAIRVGAYLTLREVASAVGADASTVLRWENGESMPRPVHAERYGDLLRELMDDT